MKQIVTAFSCLLVTFSSALSSPSPVSLAYMGAIRSYMSSMRLMKPDSNENNLNEYFDTVDANGDNLISIAEFNQYSMDRNNFTQPEDSTQYVWDILDLNRDGQIGKDEATQIIDIIENKERIDKKTSDTHVAMLIFDRNKDQKISKEEMDSFIKSIFGIEASKEDMEAFFAQMDGDKNGFIDWQELKNYMNYM